MSRTSSATSAQGSQQIWAGTSGWAYPTWKPGFYPADVSAKRFLGFYSSQLNSVEVNYTFTKLPTAEQLQGWLSQTPDGFRFSFKAPQRITHYSRLADCEQHVATFLTAIAPAAAAGRMGMILFQLPPNFKANLTRLREFLALKPLNTPSTPPIAFEFRHESWFAPEILAALTEHDAALCVAETEDFKTPEIHTASTHACFRLRQSGGYKPRQITGFANRFAELAQDRDVYAYFKHEDEPTGALNATAFLKAARKAEGK